ncbi:similar to Saccharomyces cerevisiae YDR343C HXT6 Low-affinity glucose transporter of the major facilitator superfamily [Maudiozyma saulgeensis]|uniref:Similar to Saccharomyces cerevisiae YDR343C HXT6 Low-affinity glucose transporter of the major facilitator superfamily n=1 Tax=Maudiozyma saulgeensis TaxID=1789683 RepID=A0A1X7RAB1_9SACH|nr:similar to Saccharomyces cerevisiae YDR343C HXT6 Low-affinity glucose transporter of the major facilitator superfamily [Kazachstania saulgeensis]
MSQPDPATAPVVESEDSTTKNNAVQTANEPSSTDSALSTPVNQQVNDDGGKGSVIEDNTVEVYEMPKKPASAYITVSLICLMVSFGGFIFGWDTGTISGFVQQTDFIRRFGTANGDGTFSLSRVRTGLIVSIFCIGCAIGGLLFSKLGDTYGRRIALVIVTVVYVIGILISISSVDKWYQYLIGRIFSGMGVGGISVYSPLLISEVSPKHLRGTLVSCFQLMITLGIFLGYCTNYGTKSYSNSVQWRVPLGLGFAWALFMIVAMLMVPESPRYLIKIGKIDEARRSIATSNRVSVDDPAVQAELELLNSGIQTEIAAGEASWLELFSAEGKILPRVILGVMIQSLQQLTGANYFFYYGTSIFKSIGLEDSFETSIIIGVVNFASTFVGIYFVERYGRRKCLLWGAAAMCACFVVYASVGVTKLYPNGMNNASSKSAGNTMIVFTCFFIFSFATTWAPIPYVIVAETFPLRIKAKGMSISVASNWFWNFLLSFFTPFITGAINFYYGYVFMGCLIFAWFYVFFFVPETKGLSLEEVNEMWLEGVSPWKSSNWVPFSKRDISIETDHIKKEGEPFYRKMV